MNHRNFHPEICKLLDEIEGLRTSADLQARDLLRDDTDRSFSRATADAYAYCMMRIRGLNIPTVANLNPELEEAEKMITALRYDRNFWRDEYGKGGGMTLLEILDNVPLFMPKRIPKFESDFGDSRTVGLKLKSATMILETYGDHDFAFYLGPYRNKWHVGAHRVIEFVPSKLISYDSLDELKRHWILD